MIPQQHSQQLMTLTQILSPHVLNFNHGTHILEEKHTSLCDMLDCRALVLLPEPMKQTSNLVMFFFFLLYSQSSSFI